MRTTSRSLQLGQHVSTARCGLEDVSESTDGKPCRFTQLSLFLLSVQIPSDFSQGHKDLELIFHGNGFRLNLSPRSDILPHRRPIDECQETSLSRIPFRVSFYCRNPTGASAVRLSGPASFPLRPDTRHRLHRNAPLRSATRLASNTSHQQIRPLESQILSFRATGQSGRKRVPRTQEPEGEHLDGARAPNVRLSPR